MKCIKCGHAMEPEALRTLYAEVRGERLEVQVAVPQCSHCGRLVLSGRGRRVYHRAASDAYRRKHKLLSSGELDYLRRNLGMTWKQFAEYVPIGIATLKRWLGGEIQSPSLDSLVRLKADLTFAERAKDELLARLAEKAVYTDDATWVHIAGRRGRMEVAAEDWTATDTDLAQCA